MKINKVLAYSLTLSLLTFLNMGLEASMSQDEDQNITTDSGNAPKFKYPKEVMLKLRKSPLANEPLPKDVQKELERTGTLSQRKSKL
ncbi:MAG: hypothetical protein ACTHJ4_03650 [Candidatus Nucleicultricaceae bacterium]